MEAHIRIDPALPVCWEDAETIRIGFDTAVARVPAGSAAAQRLLAALQAGIDAERDLFDLAEHCGAAPGEALRLIGLLEPVLRRRPGRPSTGAEHRAPAHPGGDGLGLQLALHSQGEPPPQLVRALVGAGCRCDLSFSYELERADLVLVFERFLEPLERFDRLSDYEVPHLLVRVTDASLAVGPLVVPGADSGACLSCEALARIDRDAGLPAVSSQLIGAVPAAETPAVLEAAAAQALWFVRRWLAGDAAVQHVQLRSPVADGLPTALPYEAAVLPHPRCGCTAGAWPCESTEFGEAGLERAGLNSTGLGDAELAGDRRRFDAARAG